MICMKIDWKLDIISQDFTNTGEIFSFYYFFHACGFEYKYIRSIVVKFLLSNIFFDTLFQVKSLLSINLIYLTVCHQV